MLERIAMARSRNSKPQSKPKSKPKSNPKKPMPQKVKNQVALQPVGGEDFPAFPDFTIEELTQRSQNLTLKTSFWQGWETTATVALNPEYVAAHRYAVPANVLELIPEGPRKLIQQAAGIQDGETLYVLRDLDVLDLFAGKARPSRWAALAGLKAAAFDKTFASHMDPRLLLLA